MSIVLATGTFDLLHPGHINYLTQAKKLGDVLIVIVARDKTVEKVKGKLPHENEKIRLEKIKKLEIVDKAILGQLKNHYNILKKIKPDIIARGYDQKGFTENLEKKIKKIKLNCKIIALKSYYPKKYKSSIMLAKNQNKC